MWSLSQPSPKACSLWSRIPSSEKTSRTPWGWSADKGLSGHRLAILPSVSPSTSPTISENCYWPSSGEGSVHFLPGGNTTPQESPFQEGLLEPLPGLLPQNPTLPSGVDSDTGAEEPSTCREPASRGLQVGPHPGSLLSPTAVTSSWGPGVEAEGDDPGD